MTKADWLDLAAVVERAKDYVMEDTCGDGCCGTKRYFVDPDELIKLIREKAATISPIAGLGSTF